MNGLFYNNKKEKQINLTVRRHALSRFVERYQIVYGKKLNPQEIISVFIKTFQQTDRVQKLKRGDKRRLKRYGEDNLFFRGTNFTFIVQNAEIITVEISRKDKRHMNKRI